MAWVFVGCPVVPPGPFECRDEGNGCGPAQLGPLVPVYANCFEARCGAVPEIVCFTCPCLAHDTCYGTCGVAKADCDQAFLDDLLDLCLTSGLSECATGECVARAYLYAALVVLAGGPAFAAARAECPGETKDFIKTAWTPGDDYAELLPFTLPYTDLDQDLLPDDWEREFGLDPLDPMDVLMDLDGDGVYPLTEYLAATGPRITESH